MPKIIENVKEKIILEGKKVLIDKSYKELNIRDIAKNCNIGIGTFYNYFSNKQALVEEIFKDDWTKSLNCIKDLKNSDVSTKEKLRTIYLSLEKFIDRYMSIFYEIAMISGYKNTHCKEFEEIYNIVKELLEEERKKGNLSCDLPSEKLARLLISNFINLSRNKYMTFDELFYMLNI